MDPRYPVTDPYLHRVRRWVFGGWCLLILGASLYPFDLDLQRLLDALGAGFPQLQEWQPSSRRDTWANVLLYVPFGALAWLTVATRHRPLIRVGLIVVGGALFSLWIELLQHGLIPRDPTPVDWALNVCGTTSGVVIGMLYRSLPIRPLTLRLRRVDPGPAPWILLMVWMATHLAPFVPRLRPGRIDAALEASLALELVPSRLFAYLACYLMLAGVVHVLWRRESFWPWWIAIMAGSLISRVLFVGQQLSPDEVCGLLGALGTMGILRARGQNGIGPGVFGSLCALIFISGTWPVPIPIDAPHPAVVQWIPFGALAGGAIDPGSLPVIEQLFLGLGIAWLAASQPVGRGWAISAALAVALCAEFLQHWIPGRLPDTSILAALLIGAALAPAISRPAGRV